MAGSWTGVLVAATIPLGLCALMAPSPGTEQPLTIGIYWVAPCVANQASRPMRYPRTGRGYCFATSAIVTQSDVVSAGFSPYATDELSVQLTLNEAASRRVFELSGKSIGKQVGVFVDSRLISLVTIEAPFRVPSIQGVSRPEALRIIAAVKAGRVAKSLPALVPVPTPLNQRDTQGIYTIGNGVSAPMLIRKREPDYTEAARAARVQGSVLLDIVVQPDGTAGAIEVRRSLDLGLDAKAIECVRDWRFRPGMKNGRPVPVRASVEINFHL
jgi:TonB family protein